MVKFAKRRRRRKRPDPANSGAPEGWQSLADRMKEEGGTRLDARPMAAPQLEGQKGRVVAVIGPPMVGTSLICRGLHEECETKTAILHGRPDPAELKQLRESGTEVVFLDGFPTTPQELQWLNDERILSGAEGAVVRVQADRLGVLNRLQAREVITGEAVELFHEGWGAFNAHLGALEERIRELSIPYFVIPNDELEVAFGELAKRSGITR